MNDTEHPIQPLEIALDGVNYTIPAESLVFGFDDPTGWKESYCTFGIALSTEDDGTAYNKVALGGGFFKDFVTTIDYDTNRYGFGMSKGAHNGALINGKSADGL